MRRLGEVFLFFIILSIVHIDWGNVIESEVNLSLETKYEIDVDNDGMKESDKSERESNFTSHFLYFEKIDIPLISRIESVYRQLISNYFQDNYSFYLLSRIERPPSSKLI